MRLKIVSLNIWHGAFLSNAIKFLQSQDADIILLQEVYASDDGSLDEKYNSFTSIKSALGYDYSNFVQSYLEDYQGYLIPHGNAIYSRIKITNQSELDLMAGELESYIDQPSHWPILPAKLQHVELEHDGININIFNMHGIWDLNGDDLSPRRQEMFAKIVEATKGLSNIILAGDTNAKPSNPGFNQILEYLNPVFDDELKTTFNMRHKTNPGYASSAVDLMFVSPEIEIASKEVPDIDVSDHLPLVVSLEIPQPSRQLSL